MSAPTMTRDLAWSAATDAANAQMRTAGRSKWSPEDYALAVREFDRLWPESRDYIGAAEAQFERLLTVTRNRFIAHLDGDPTNNDLDNLEIRTGYADVDSAQTRTGLRWFCLNCKTERHPIFNGQLTPSCVACGGHMEPRVRS